ncbi:hypothetical protein TNCV_3592121 [Trichonephila clavipes]|nr:hypothetical protein TNCV_3592121 [Trichonephila clavipes]
MMRNRLNADVAARSITPYAQSSFHHRYLCNKVNAIGTVGPSFSPASSDDRFASHSRLVWSNTLRDFSEG